MNTENNFKNRIKNLIRGEMDQIHTALPGCIVSYDPGTNRASVQPVGAFKTEDGRSLAFPVIHEVPVQFPCGSGGSVGVTFPIIAGDTGILIFSESQLDDYLSGGDSDDPRRFALTDGMFIPGMYTAPPSGEAGHPNDLCLSFKGYTVVLGEAGFVVTVGSSSFSLTPTGFYGNINGTSFSIGGGDLVVNGVSLTQHTHSGVEPGGGSTGSPNKS